MEATSIYIKEDKKYCEKKEKCLGNLETILNNKYKKNYCNNNSNINNNNSNNSNINNINSNINNINSNINNNNNDNELQEYKFNVDESIFDPTNASPPNPWLKKLNERIEKHIKGY